MNNPDLIRALDARLSTRCYACGVRMMNGRPVPWAGLGRDRFDTQGVFQGLEAAKRAAIKAALGYRRREGGKVDSLRRAYGIPKPPHEVDLPLWFCVEEGDGERTPWEVVSCE